MTGLESNLILTLPLVGFVVGTIWALGSLDRWRAEALERDAPPEGWTADLPEGWTALDVARTVAEIESLG